MTAPLYLTAERRKWAALALNCAAVVFLGDMYLIQPILPLIAKQFGIFTYLPFYLIARPSACPPGWSPLRT